MVLPSNSPGVHTLWMPVIPMQIGLVLKPGPQEPWTPYRMAQAMFQSGVPTEAISLYPGGMEAGMAVLETCDRTMLFGSQATVDQHAGNPKIQVHGPGYTKILIGDDKVDQLAGLSGSDGNAAFCSTAAAVASTARRFMFRGTARDRAGSCGAAGEGSTFAARRSQSSAGGFHRGGRCRSDFGGDRRRSQGGRRGRHDCSGSRTGSRAITRAHCSYLLPTVVYCKSPEVPIAKKEFMFPFVNVVECPQEKMLDSIGPTLVCSGITEDPNSAACAAGLRIISTA